jgi:HPt (histidine-containing phosphotransfer) domain-containing protein
MVADTSVVLDRDQLRGVTLDDQELMREILQTLIDDTARQLSALEAAIRAADRQRLARLAHYSKGACANVGAIGAAAMLQNIERKAATGDFAACGASLTVLAEELQKLRREAGSL